MVCAELYYTEVLCTRIIIIPVILCSESTSKHHTFALLVYFHKSLKNKIFVRVHL